MDNRKKIVLAVLLVILAVVLWISFGGKAPLVDSIDAPRTKVEHLKQVKVEMLEKSGYNECARQVAEKSTLAGACVSEKLGVSGYADGVDCFEGSEDVVCQDADRYNAQVDAENECEVAYPTNATDLTDVDCMKLLNNAF